MPTVIGVDALRMVKGPPGWFNETVQHRHEARVSVKSVFVP